MVVTPATEPEPLATGAASPEAASPGREEDGCEASDSSGEEQSAAAALLGLHAAWPSSPDEEEDAARDDGLTPLGYDLWDAAAAAAGHRMFYDSPTALSSLEPYSPKNYRQHNLVDYDTPGHPSPKRMRAPKDGTPRTIHPDPLLASHLWPHPYTHHHTTASTVCLLSDAPYGRLHVAGAPPPGTSRFRCKFPGCRKLYASTDAVRPSVPQEISVRPANSHPGGSRCWQGMGGHGGGAEAGRGCGRVGRASLHPSGRPSASPCPPFRLPRGRMRFDCACPPHSRPTASARIRGQNLFSGGRRRLCGLWACSPDLTTPLLPRRLPAGP